MNPVNKLPISYKLDFAPVPLMLVLPSSYHAKRAAFTDHHLYVTKYRPDEMYPGGKLTNQSTGHTGIKSWIEKSKGEGNSKTVDEDVVLWVQFGLNHFPRILDLPVMPVERVSVNLRPVNFFTRNPAINVPPSTQASYQSVLVTGEGQSACTDGCAKL